LNQNDVYNNNYVRRLNLMLEIDIIKFFVTLSSTFKCFT